MPRELRVNADGYAITIVGTDESVEHIEVAFAQVGFNPRKKCVEGIRTYRCVRVAPIDVPLAGRLLNEELILGGAARVRPCIDDKLTVASENALAAGKSMFYQLGCG